VRSATGTNHFAPFAAGIGVELGFAPGALKFNEQFQDFRGKYVRVALEISDPFGSSRHWDDARTGIAFHEVVLGVARGLKGAATEDAIELDKAGHENG
jgi:hypothetical protein